MRLFEIDSTTSKLVAAIDQLQNKVKEEKLENWPVSKFLKYLSHNGVSLDENTLFDMIKKPPMKNLVSNIKDKKVIFKGYDSDNKTADSDDKSKKIVKKMAAKAK